MSIYIYLSSTDSTNVFPDNNSFDFTVDLNRNISGRFLVALSDFYCENFNEPLYIFCDIVNTSFIHGQYLPALRLVHANGEAINLQYHKASRNSIQRIRVYIRDKDLKLPSLPIGRVSCVLKLINY